MEWFNVSILALALLWVAVWEPLAPASRRATWRDQWRGDLWHYWTWLRGPANPALSPTRAACSLFVRAVACVPHAALLRVSEWSLHMVLHDLKFAWRMLVRRPAFPQASWRQALEVDVVGHERPYPARVLRGDRGGEP